MLNSKYIFIESEGKKELQDYSYLWFAKNQSPVLQPAMEKSTNIYLILSGKVHIMDPSGMIEYGILYEGSYFGDISLLNDEPNYFSYFSDPYSIRPLELLEIDGKCFLELLDSYYLGKKEFMLRLKVREKLFNSYKTICLLEILKSA